MCRLHNLVQDVNSISYSQAAYHFARRDWMTGSLVETLAPPMMAARGRLACSSARWSSSLCIRKPQHAYCTCLAMPAGGRMK